MMTEGQSEKKGSENVIIISDPLIVLILIVELFHLRHLERGGVGGAVLALAQGRPLHHAVLDALNLPPDRKSVV